MSFLLPVVIPPDVVVTNLASSIAYSACLWFSFNLAAVIDEPAEYSCSGLSISVLRYSFTLFVPEAGAVVKVTVSPVI